MQLLLPLVGDQVEFALRHRPRIYQKFDRQGADYSIYQCFYQATKSLVNTIYQCVDHIAILFKYVLLLVKPSQL